MVAKLNDELGPLRFVDMKMLDLVLTVAFNFEVTVSITFISTSFSLLHAIGKDPLKLGNVVGLLNLTISIFLNRSVGTGRVIFYYVQRQIYNYIIDNCID